MVPQAQEVPGPPREYPRPIWHRGPVDPAALPYLVLWVHPMPQAVARTAEIMSFGESAFPESNMQSRGSDVKANARPVFCSTPVDLAGKM
jgi:hypothetical protein